MKGKTLKELIEIAKEYDLKLSYKNANGKRKKYNKLELRKMIIDKIVDLAILDLNRDMEIIKNGYKVRWWNNF